eukprot:2267064-Alexandrium_andersonii.AAC.1
MRIGHLQPPAVAGSIGAWVWIDSSSPWTPLSFLVRHGCVRARARALPPGEQRRLTEALAGSPPQGWTLAHGDLLSPPAHPPALVKTTSTPR